MKRNSYLFSQWWSQPDRFRWLSDYLASRRVQDTTRYVMAGVVFTLGAIPAVMLWSPAGPRGTTGHAVTAVVVGCCLAMSVCWLVRWPTRRESEWFTAVSTLCIAAACLLDGNPLAGLMGCTAFAALGGYIALFHSSRHLMLNLLAGTTCMVLLAIRVAGTGDVVLAVGKSLLLLVANLAIPFTVQILVGLLGVDELHSNLDPLTGLFNRRGFTRGVTALVSDRDRAADRHLAVMMVDIDDFKAVNDVHGHDAGDQVLIAVSHILRTQTRNSAVVARTGGEEFLVIDRLATADAAAAAERLRSAIALAPLGITASIGMASAVLDQVAMPTRHLMVADLVHSADAAMYEAKRAGGNRTAHWSQPTVTTDRSG